MTGIGNEFNFGDKAFGLIIGVSEFQDPGYSETPLPQAVHDAEDLALLLQERLGWKADNIEILLGEVRKEDVGTAFKTLKAKIGASGADLLLFYLSTHGHPYNRLAAGVETVFLASNTSLKDPFELTDTGLTKHILGAYIDAIPARQKVIISDACFSASGIQADEIVPPQKYAGIDAAVLSSAVGRAYAQQGRNSVFTECLLRVLTESNGEVGVGGLADAISRALPKEWPRPFFDTSGRYIVLGVVGDAALRVQQITFQRLLLFSQSQLQLALGRYRSIEIRPEGYVPRKSVENAFREYLNDPTGRTFSVVGPAGVGKSTLLMHLAEEVNSQEFPVLWFSSAHLNKSMTIESLIVATVASLNKDATLSHLSNVLESHNPLLIFIDAINEWTADSAALERFVADLENLSSDGSFRAIFSCREELWLQLNQKRREAKIPELQTNARLSIFDEEEFAAAKQLYRLPEISVGTLIRQPLFLKMVSVVLSGDAPSTAVGFVDLFEMYVEAKTSRVDLRLGLQSGETLSRAERVALTMSRNKSESTGVDKFLSIVSEPIAVALFDEGLFRRVGKSVSVETELVFEYLLSRTLPPDPFVQTKEATRRFENLDSAWWRAAAFKLWKMDDVVRVRDILDFLLSEDTSYWKVRYVMRLGFNWKDITPFRNQYLKAYDLGGAYLSDEAFTLLQKVAQENTREKLEFVLDVIRILLQKETYVDWRPKKWDSLDINGLRRRFTRDSEHPNRPTSLLSDCFATSPYVTFYLLISKWLNDNTKLADHEAMICDVATMFLMSVAPHDPDDFQRAVTDCLRDGAKFSYEGGRLLHKVLGWAVDHNPNPYVDVAEKWISDSSKNFQYVGLEVIRHLPENLATEALRIVTRYLEQEALPLQMANQAIAWLGNIPSRKVLGFLIQYSELAEHQVAVAEACHLLFPAFPNDVVRLINQMAEQPLMRKDAREAILNFYRYHLAAASKNAIQFFRRAIEVEPDIHNRSISYSIEGLQKLDPYVSGFVEERLKEETDGLVLEHYNYYLKRLRMVSVEDVAWIKRWIESGSPSYGLLGYVAISPLPRARKLEIISMLDQLDSQFIEHCVNGLFRDEEGEALREFAIEVCSSPAYDSLSSEAKKWFTLMSNGKSPYDAYTAIRSERGW
jgi:hypothetical protein